MWKASEAIHLLLLLSLSLLLQLLLLLLTIIIIKMSLVNIPVISDSSLGAGQRTRVKGSSIALNRRVITLLGEELVAFCLELIRTPSLARQNNNIG